jgi:hypothetical protein
MARDCHDKPDECFPFVWRRREKGPGFRWERESRHGHRVLLGPPDDKLREYQPLVEETGLFLTFAFLDGSDAAFLRFADTYGRLGTYHRYWPDGGEPLYEWQQHHRWMNFLAKLRGAYLADHQEELGKVVSWKGDEVVYRFPKIGTGAAETWHHQGQLRRRLRGKNDLPLFQPGDVRGPVLWFLCFAIDDWLHRLQDEKPIAPRMVWSEEACRPQFVFGPSSLLGAMVCQFAAALNGSWPFKPCAFCHKFFRLAPGVNRADRLTCSHTCKQYLHNHRVERARQLRAEGWTVRQIIGELAVKPQGEKSSAAIVKAWIGKRPASISDALERGDVAKVRKQSGAREH